VVFQRQIEVKQKELAPWTAKVNTKQAEIDLAESERALLADKATGAQAAVDEAIQGLEKLKADKAVKEEELETLNVEREGLKKQIKAGESKFRVSGAYFTSLLVATHMWVGRSECRGAG
jgi:structural maintenance of chromosome 4